ncbi:MAG: hypothetical protein PHV13_03550 [Candidatus ainarchaeum sp.]|nr:hypothetical protein [Candidatus ainarchaeum sp.]
MMHVPVQKKTGGSQPAAPFPVKQPLTESNGYEYYVVYMLKPKNGGQAAYGAVRLSRKDATTIRELDRRLTDNAYDLYTVRSERTLFFTERARDFKAFMAPADKYDFGFMPAADAQRLVMKI